MHQRMQRGQKQRRIETQQSWPMLTAHNVALYLCVGGGGSILGDPCWALLQPQLLQHLFSASTRVTRCFWFPALWHRRQLPRVVFAGKHCCVCCMCVLLKSFHCVGGCVREGQKGGFLSAWHSGRKGLPPHAVATSSHKPQILSVFDDALTLNQYTNTKFQLECQNTHHHHHPSFIVKLPE